MGMAGGRLRTATGMIRLDGEGMIWFLRGVATAALWVFFIAALAALSAPPFIDSQPIAWFSAFCLLVSAACAVAIRVMQRRHFNK